MRRPPGREVAVTMLETVLTVAVILLAVVVAAGFVVAIRVLRQLGVGGLSSPVEKPEMAGKGSRGKRTPALAARPETPQPAEDARAAAAAARSDAAAAKAEAAAARADARRILESAR